MTRSQAQVLAARFLAQTHLPVRQVAAELRPGLPAEMRRRRVDEPGRCGQALAAVIQDRMGPRLLPAPTWLTGWLDNQPEVREAGRCGE